MDSDAAQLEMLGKTMRGSVVQPPPSFIEMLRENARVANIERGDYIKAKLAELFEIDSYVKKYVEQDATTLMGWFKAESLLGRTYYSKVLSSDSKLLCTTFLAQLLIAISSDDILANYTGLDYEFGEHSRTIYGLVVAEICRLTGLVAYVTTDHSPASGICLNKEYNDNGNLQFKLTTWI
jgi:hypothetical protein